MLRLQAVAPIDNPIPQEVVSPRRSISPGSMKQKTTTEASIVPLHARSPVGAPTERAGANDNNLCERERYGQNERNIIEVSTRVSMFSKGGDFCPQESKTESPTPSTSLENKSPPTFLAASTDSSEQTYDEQLQSRNTAGVTPWSPTPDQRGEKEPTTKSSITAPNRATAHTCQPEAEREAGSRFENQREIVDVSDRDPPTASSPSVEKAAEVPESFLPKTTATTKTAASSKTANPQSTIVPQTQEKAKLTSNTSSCSHEGSLTPSAHKGGAPVAALTTQQAIQSAEPTFPQSPTGHSDRHMPPTSGVLNADGIPQAHRTQQYIQAEYQQPQQQPKYRMNQNLPTGGPTQNHRLTLPPNGGSLRANEEENGTRTSQPAPLFERLVSEEVQELKAYARIIESQNRRLSELEKVHGDLEKRLQQEAKKRLQLEATLEERERHWAHRFEELQADRDRWEQAVETERSKNQKLIVQVNRKDKDIQRMLQRKYDTQRDIPHSQVSSSVRNVARPTDRTDRSNVQGSNRSPESVSARRDNKSPHDFMNSVGSAETVRTGNVVHLLENFFGL